MARDSTLQLRQAVVTTLKADGPLTALVDEDNVHGMRTPATLTWPFVRYGVPDVLPMRAQCLDGVQVRFAVHSFSKAAYEDEVANMNAAVAAALDSKTIELDTDFSAKAHIRWLGSRVLADPAEANAWHGIAEFEAGIAS